MCPFYPFYVVAPAEIGSVFSSWCTLFKCDALCEVVDLVPRLQVQIRIGVRRLCLRPAAVDLVIPIDLNLQDKLELRFGFTCFYCQVYSFFQKVVGDGICV